MIFVTVGTTNYCFDRLFKEVDKSLERISSQEELVVQKGPSLYNFKHKNTKVFSQLSYEQMIFNFKQARVIVGHGGLGTIYLSIKYGKNRPIIFPRSKKFKEHINNHQIEFVNKLQKKGLITVIFPQDEKLLLDDFIKNKIPSSGKISFDCSSLVKNLINYTQNFQK